MCVCVCVCVSKFCTATLFKKTVNKFSWRMESKR